ncbi:MAG: penicillin-binding protein 1C [Polyangiales bacterium]|jgi:penicillin-binding protein 1C
MILWSTRSGFAKRVVLALVLALGVHTVWPTVAPGLIEPERFVQPRDSFRITDRHGLALRLTRPDGEDRRWVRLEDVSPRLIEAFLATEDANFYEHEGVDWSATLRSSLSFITPGRRLSGGSTLSQQTVKMVYGRPHGLWDKPFEMVRALALEEHFSKREILEQYLNRVPFGDQIVGVARASEAYFGKAPSELTVGEAALLAGIPQAPSATEPRRHRDRAIRRQRFVLHRMRATGAISELVLQTELARFPRIREESTRPWHAPRFVEGVLASGDPRSQSELRTSLDRQLHVEARQLTAAAVRQLSGRGVRNGAAVVLHNGTGEILAYVSAADPRGPGGSIDLLRAQRQPGSSLKPFVYELLFERGGHPATWLDDISTPMTGAGGALFETQDYDGRERGPVLARFALASSLNLAAIDAARRAGSTRLAHRLDDLGFDVGRPEDHGAGLALGGIDVSPMQLARAVQTLARFGRRLEPTHAPSTLRSGSRVMDRSAAALAIDVLRDGDARRAAFGDDLEEIAGGPFGLKTGTSSAWHDAWASAFDERFTVVVWLGDPAGAAMNEVSGFEAAAPVAARILAQARAHQDLYEGPGKAGDAPPSEEALVCSLSGARPTQSCPAAHLERFSPGESPMHICDVHEANGDIRLPARYARWSAAMRRTHDRIAEENQAPLRIAYPTADAQLLVDGRRPPTIPLRAARGRDDVPAEFFVDGRAVERWIPTAGTHQITAALGEERVTVEVQVRLIRR